MMTSYFPLLISLLLSFTPQIHARAECRQRLYEARGSPNDGTNGFSLHIEDPSKNFTAVEGYTPGQLYRVSIKGWRSEHIVQTFRGFGITALLANGKQGGKFELDSVGGFWKELSNLAVSFKKASKACKFLKN